MQGGFQNPPVGAQGVLERATLQSLGFQSGVKGWQITRTGNAEFNNAFVRGSFQATSITAGSIGNSVFTAGTVTNSTISYSTITLDSTAGLLFVYTNSTTVSTFNSSGSFSVPAGVTSLKAECVGGGGGGWDGLDSAAGGGGGEYAAEPSLTVTPLETLTVTVGSGGNSGTGLSFPPSAGGASQLLRGSTALVSAAGGGIGTGATAAPGGTGSTASVHFNGGSSPLAGQVTPCGGSGGGGAGGSSSSGHNGSAGQTGSPFSGGAGAAAVTGGGAGGTGGAGSGSSGTSGAAGGLPGGGGGAGGLGATSGAAGGVGGLGRVILTYTQSRVLIGAIAPAAGTDSLGNPYPQGISAIQAGVDYATLAPNGSHAALLLGPVGAAADTNLYRAGAGLLATDSSLQIGGVGNVLPAWKTGHTGRQNTTTLAADPDLSVLLTANAVWEVALHVSYQCSTAGVNMKWSFGVPSGASGPSYSSVYVNTGGTVSVEDHNWTDTSAGSTANSGNFTILIRGTIQTTSAGFFSFNWAQNSSNATFLFVNQGSHLIATRIG